MESPLETDRNGLVETAFGTRDLRPRRLWRKVLRVVLGRRVKGRCLVISEAVYSVFGRLNPKADYRINIVLRKAEAFGIGHAWVTRDGKDFLSHLPTADRTGLSYIGENTKYRFYVT